MCYVMESIVTFVNEEKKIIKKPLLTLKEIAPKWAERLQQGNKLPFPLSLTWLKWYYELDHPSKCVVGEAHGYNPTYQKQCKECNSLGWEFGGSFLLRSRSGLQRDIDAFVEHWNEKHTRCIREEKK
jgi:hypothetical protein